MKKVNKYILLLLIAITLPLLTSCFSDSDADNSNSVLDDKEVAEYLTKMKGSYNGKCYYSYIGKGSSGAPILKQDSLENVQWTLLDNGEMTISKLPVSMFAGALKAGSHFDFLADEISKCEDITLEAKILPYRTTDGWNYPFIIYPKDNIVLNIKEEERNYKVVLYYQNVVQILGLFFNMNGMCNIHENRMFLQFPIGSSTVNEVQTGVSPSLYKYNGSKKEKK